MKRIVTLFFIFAISAMGFGESRVLSTRLKLLAIKQKIQKSPSLAEEPRSNSRSNH